MAVEQVFAATPLAAGGSRVIAAPFQFYATGEDNLRIVSANSKAGVQLLVQGRFLDNKEGIKAFRHDHTPNTDRSIRTQDYPLGVGAVLNLTVFASAGAPRIGQTFVIVQLVRGTGAAALVLGTLLSAYVTEKQGPGWPGSPIESSIAGGGDIRPVDPSTGATDQDFFVVVPTGARWELLTVGGRLQAVGAGPARQPALLFDDAGLIFAESVNPGTLAAGSTSTFCWSQGMTLETVIGGALNVAGLPMHLPLLAGYRVSSVTANGLVTDVWNNMRILVREWLEVN